MNEGIRLVSVLLIVTALLPRTGDAQDADPLGARAAEGSAAMKDGRFDDAARIYAELVTARPADPGLLMNLGMARYMAGHPADAIAPLQQATRLGPTLAPAALFLGAALLDLGRTDEARPPLERAVKAMPADGRARELLARVNLALLRYASAATHYRTLTTLEPGNPKAWYGLARSYQGIAEDAFSTMQRDLPDSPLLVLLFAEVMVSQERYPAALSLYRRALEHPLPVGGVHESVAELYERAGRPDWAAAELQKSRRRSPGDCATRRAECEFLEGHYRQALTIAGDSAGATGSYWTVRAANRLATESVVRLEALPPSIELHLIRAEMAQSRDDHVDAVTEIRAALAMSPEDPSLQAALAEALVGARNLDEALPMLERLTVERPDAKQLLFLYGDALLQSQRLDRAIAVLEQVVKADPSLLAARAALGRAYVQAGRFDVAVAHLEASASKDEDGDVHYQLARAYQALGRQDEARRALEAFQRRRKSAAPAGGSETPAATLTPPD